MNFLTKALASLILILYFIFVGYKKIMVIFWLLFPAIFYIISSQDYKEMFRNDLFLPIWFISTMIFYVLYFLLLKYFENLLNDKTNE